jgi:hypothetical protein
MNKEILFTAQEAFLSRYPGGFEHPEMVEIGKKHKIQKLYEKSREVFDPKAFLDSIELTDSMTKFVSSSSLVSVFEKPKFRDAIRSMALQERGELSNALFERLYGDEGAGFGKMVEILSRYKLAKWTLLSVYPFYIRPQDEVFMKPTTVKNVISYFQIQELQYKPQPSYPFYSAYRKTILEMKSLCVPELQGDNGFFSGFLMMSSKPG